MRPVLHQQPRPAGRVRPGGVVDQPRVVGAEPAEDRHVVGADRDVHRVELQQPDPGEQPREVPAGDGPDGRASAKPCAASAARRAAAGPITSTVSTAVMLPSPTDDFGSPSAAQRAADAYRAGVVPSIRRKSLVKCAWSCQPSRTDSSARVHRRVALQLDGGLLQAEPGEHPLADTPTLVRKCRWRVPRAPADQLGQLLDADQARDRPASGRSGRAGAGSRRPVRARAARAAPAEPPDVRRCRRR